MRSDAISPKVADVLEKVMSQDTGIINHHQESHLHYNTVRKPAHRAQLTPGNTTAEADEPRNTPVFHTNHKLLLDKYSKERKDVQRVGVPLNNSVNYRLEKEEQLRNAPLLNNSFGDPYNGTEREDIHRCNSDLTSQFQEKSDREEQCQNLFNNSYRREDDESRNASLLNSTFNDSFPSDDETSNNTPSKQKSEFNDFKNCSPEDYAKNLSFQSGASPNGSLGHSYDGYPSPQFSLPTPPVTDLSRKSVSPNSTSTPYFNSSAHLSSNGLYFCHLCNYSGKIKEDFDLHMSIHFEYSCPHCDYTSRTEGRLKRHIKDFHSGDNSDGSGSKMQRTMPGRPKVYRCKQCDFSSITKIDFWQHSRSHIKEEKLLQCPRCPFVTEYKHHLEYHLRNHFGSKPFKCTKCNYSCVNKSMLNSHMKSHTNVYQYRCADCTYATKYCHSLKLHLRKYNHKPAAVLNMDGSLPQGLDIESSGLSLLAKRGPPRGPRGPRKDKSDPFMGPLFQLPHSTMAGMGPSLNGAIMSPYWPLLNHFPNGIHAPPSLVPVNNMNPLGPQLSLSSSSPKTSNSNKPEGSTMKCSLCSFTAETPEALNSHLLKVHAAENQDLFNMFGISSESLLDEQTQKTHQVQQQQILTKPPETAGHNPTKNPSSMLHVQTDTGSDLCKTSPHSWPRNTPIGQQASQASSSHSLPELLYSSSNGSQNSSQPQDLPNSPPQGTDILKEMTLKFGSSNTIIEGSRKESPLDLTKPKSVSPPTTSPQPPTFMGMKRPHLEVDVSSGNENSLGGETVVASPRKRSRKGKAYKLDTLCLKLQEKQSGSPYESESEDSSSEIPPELVTETRPQMEDVAASNRENTACSDSLSLQQDEDKKCRRFNGSEPKSPVLKSANENPQTSKMDFEQIHTNLKFLNNELKNGLPKEPIKLEHQDSHPEVSDGHDQTEDSSDKSQPDVPQDQAHMTILNSVYLNRRKPMSPALRRGTELAWKILNDPTTPSAPPNQNGEIVLEISRNGLTQNKPNSMQSNPVPSNNLNHLTPKSFQGADCYECNYCDIAFRDCVMYTMHMGYHGYQDPYKCNMCGHCSKDKVEFFLHIARAAHS